MKKIIIGGIGVMLLFAFVFTYQVQKSKAVGAFFRSGQDNPQYQTSSTSTQPAYIKAGLASSTNTFNTSDCSSITTVAKLFASSTATNSWVEIERQGSIDGMTWGTYDTSTASSTTLRPSTQPLIWKPSTLGATTTKFFDIQLIPTRYTRFITTVGTTTSGVPSAKDEMSVWFDIACNIQNY